MDGLWSLAPLLFIGLIIWGLIHGFRKNKKMRSQANRIIVKGTTEKGDMKDIENNSSDSPHIIDWGLYHATGAPFDKNLRI